jgi:hypothetical protein
MRRNHFTLWTVTVLDYLAAFEGCLNIGDAPSLDGGDGDEN